MLHIIYLINYEPKVTSHSFQSKIIQIIMWFQVKKQPENEQAAKPKFVDG